MEIIYQLVDKDKELLLFLNSKHVAWLDPIMLVLSSYPCWIIACLLFVAILYLKGDVWRRSAPVFLLITVGMSALFTKIVKEIVERPRPIHNNAWKDILHALEEYEASYSFFSSHSATTFAMATFFFLFFRAQKAYGIIALLWALMVAYSRIYLAKHYPLDVTCGIVVGILVGMLGYKLFEYYKARKTGLMTDN